MRFGRGLIFAFFIVSVGGLACGGGAPQTGSGPAELDADGGVASCTVAAPTACPAPAPRYADIQPIMERNCAAPCHSGIPGGPWPLTSYEPVADWADAVRSDLLDCSMPPADGGVVISSDDRMAILTWIRCGYPE